MDFPIKNHCYVSSPEGTKMTCLVILLKLKCSLRAVHFLKPTKYNQVHMFFHYECYPIVVGDCTGCIPFSIIICLHNSGVWVDYSSAPEAVISQKILLFLVLKTFWNRTMVYDLFKVPYISLPIIWVNYNNSLT